MRRIKRTISRSVLFREHVAIVTVKTRIVTFATNQTYRYIGTFARSLCGPKQSKKCTVLVPRSQWKLHGLWERTPSCDGYGLGESWWLGKKGMLLRAYIPETLVLVSMLNKAAPTASALRKE